MMTCTVCLAIATACGYCDGHGWKTADVPLLLNNCTCEVVIGHCVALHSSLSTL